MLSWKEFNNSLRGCKKCSLYKKRTNVVIGRGNVKAPVLFVGEAPGRDEDIKGSPFVGKAGMLFDNLLNAIPFKKEEYYITNIVKCRPPNNRDPRDREAETCIRYLRAQFKLVRPKIIVCLGRIASKYMIDSDIKITRDRGKWTEKNGIKMIPVYHPAYLLRNENEKVKTWHDFIKIREVLNKIYEGE